MIVGHQAINRTILSLFLFQRAEDVPYTYIPRHNITISQSRNAENSLNCRIMMWYSEAGAAMLCVSPWDEAGARYQEEVLFSRSSFSAQQAGSHLGDGYRIAQQREASQGCRRGRFPEEWEYRRRIVIFHAAVHAILAPLGRAHIRFAFRLRQGRIVFGSGYLPGKRGAGGPKAGDSQTLRRQRAFRSINAGKHIVFQRFCTVFPQETARRFFSLARVWIGSQEAMQPRASCSYVQAFFPCGPPAASLAPKPLQSNALAASSALLSERRRRASL